MSNLSQSEVNAIAALMRFIEPFSNRDFGSIELAEKQSDVSGRWVSYLAPKASYSEAVSEFVSTTNSILKLHREIGDTGQFLYDDPVHDDGRRPFYCGGSKVWYYFRGLKAVLDAEALSDGPLMEYLQRGSISAWLESLQSIANADTDKRLMEAGLSQNAGGLGSLEAERAFWETPQYFDPVEAPEEEAVLARGLQYTVEPADVECKPYFKWDPGRRRRNEGGGIGQYLSQRSLFDYEAKGYPSLTEFLDHFVFVGPIDKQEDRNWAARQPGTKHYAYPSYFADDIEDIRSYVSQYVDSFAKGAGKEVLEAIDNYQGSFDSGYFGSNVVMFENYFERIFTSCSQIVAKRLFSESLMNSIHTSTDGGIVQCFERLYEQKIFFIERQDVFHIDEYSPYGLRPKGCIVCCKKDYFSSIKPYIVFLSNFRLVLASYIALKRYGQCHFSLCWQTETGADLSPEYWPHPKGNDIASC